MLLWALMENTRCFCALIFLKSCLLSCGVFNFQLSKGLSIAILRGQIFLFSMSYRELIMRLCIPTHPSLPKKREYAYRWLVWQVRNDNQEEKSYAGRLLPKTSSIASWPCLYANRCDAVTLSASIWTPRMGLKRPYYHSSRYNLSGVVTWTWIAPRGPGRLHQTESQDQEGLL